MIDLAELTSLFFEASKQWTEPKVATMHRLSDIKREPAYQALLTQGCKTHWANEARVRQIKSEGWKPVAERDAIGRPTIFMDRNREMVLMYLTEK
jgi:hypothetical protein